MFRSPTPPHLERTDPCLCLTARPQADPLGRQSNPQSAFWLEALYRGIHLESVDSARGTAILGTASAEALPGGVAIPSALVVPGSPLGVPIPLEDALGVAYEICVLVGAEMLLDLLYTRRALPFYRDLYRRLQRDMSVPWVVSLGLMVGRLDVWVPAPPPPPAHRRPAHRRHPNHTPKAREAPAVAPAVVVVHRAGCGTG